MSANPPPDRVEFELRDYIGVLHRRWRWILAFVVVLVLGGLAFSLRKPTIYQAQAGVLLDAGFSRTILFTDQTNIPNIDEQVTTESDLMKSSNVQDAIKKELGYLPMVDVEVASSEGSSANDEPKTRIINVAATSSSPEAAQKAANDFSTAYVKVRRRLIDADLRANIGENDQALENLDVSTAKKQGQIDTLNKEIPLLGGEKKRILQARRDRLLEAVSPGSVKIQQDNIQDRTNQLSAALINNDGRSIFRIALADPPTSPIQPRPVRDGTIALLIGLGLGIIAAFLRDYYDDTIRTKDDIERITTNIPVLGIIPAIKPWHNKDEAVLETVARPGSPASEAYRALRTAVEFTGVGREFRLIHVTSAAPGEGKSTTASNLAVSLARSGKEVILVDCDLRRPRAHKFFDLDNGVGFTTLLLGTSSVEESLQRVPDVPGLFVVPSGPLPPNPSELLDSGVTMSRLQLLTKSAQYVIVDSPPILPVADSIILGSHADATLLVIKAKSTNRRSIARSLELLNQVEAPVAGIVLNGVGDEGTYGYDYGYYKKDDPRFSPHLGERSHEMVTGFSDTSGEEGPKAEGEPDAVQDLH